MIDPDKDILDQGLEIRRMVNARIGERRTHRHAARALAEILEEQFAAGKLTLKELCSFAAQGAVCPSPGFDFGTDVRFEQAHENAKALGLPPQVTKNLAKALVALGCENMPLDKPGLETVVEKACRKWDESKP